MADEQPAEEEVDDYPPPPSKMPMIIGMVVMLVAGGGGGFFAAGMMGGEPPPEEGEEGAEDEEAVPVTRAVHNLGRFTVNLRGTSGGRVLRTEVQVEVLSDEVPVIEERTPQLRDAVLTLASDYSYAELEGLDGKMRLRDELLGRLNANLDDTNIERVYFTEFVVQ